MSRESRAMPASSPALDLSDAPRRTQRSQLRRSRIGTDQSAHATGLRRTDGPRDLRAINDCPPDFLHAHQNPLAGCAVNILILSRRHRVRAERFSASISLRLTVYATPDGTLQRQSSRSLAARRLQAASGTE